MQQLVENAFSTSWLPRVFRPGAVFFVIAYERSAAGSVVAATAAIAAVIAAAPTAVAAAAPNDDQQNDDPAAVTAAPTIVTHTGTSYENVDRNRSQSIVCQGRGEVTVISGSRRPYLRRFGLPHG